MLTQPTESLEIIHPSHPKTEELAVTCFDFPENELSTFWIGTEEGNIYQANRYDRAGLKAGLGQEMYTGHSGFITGMHFHPLNSLVDFSELVVSSSIDWTVQLWRAKVCLFLQFMPLTLFIADQQEFERRRDAVTDLHV